MRWPWKKWDEAIREQRIKELKEAAKPPVCPKCGVEAFFHYCEKFLDES